MTTGLILAMIGLGLMVGLTGAGSAIGTAIGGASVIGMTKKKPDQFFTGLILAGMPATQGLYGFVAFFMFNGSFSAEGMSSLTVAQGAVTLGAGLALGLAGLISAIQQGKVCANGITGLASGHGSKVNTMLLAALPEFYAILGLVAALMMMPLLG